LCLQVDDYAKCEENEVTRPRKNTPSSENHTAKGRSTEEDKAPVKKRKGRGEPVKPLSFRPEVQRRTWGTLQRERGGDKKHGGRHVAWRKVPRGKNAGGKDWERYVMKGMY